MIPFPTLQNASAEGVKTMKSAQELKEAFSAAGVDPAQGAIFTCGAAITACIDALGFEAAFGSAGKYSVYDGSFSEWKARA